MSALKAPFPYFGGKSRAADLVWSRLGDVSNYVEPFAGSLAVLLRRPHEPRIETVNDRDCYLSNFWRALRADPEAVAYHCDWPVNECDLHARHRWLCDQADFRERMQADPEFHDAKIAGWWAWGISQWIGGGWCSMPEWKGRGGGGRAPREINTVDARRPNAHNMGVTRKLPTRGQDSNAKRPVINRGGRGVTSALEASSSSPLLDWMMALASRLRRVRVICGDWARVVTPSCTWKVGGGTLTGVFLDPPYSHEMRDRALYSVDVDIAAQVRAWAIEAADNPRMRIALCGFEGEHEMPASWEVAHWNAPRGYSNKPAAERRKETIWFSSHCIKQRTLFSEEVSA